MANKFAKSKAKKKVVARKKSVVLKKAVKPSKAEQIKSDRNIVAILRTNLVGFKADLRDAKSAARAANKDVSSALKVISKQNVAINKIATRIKKLRAA